MAYSYTPWGYEIDGTLSPLLTVADFNTLTGSKWASDTRIETAIAAASAVIRNHCGWHVTPSLTCRATVDGEGVRSVWLPCSHLTGVTSVTDSDGDALEFTWSRLGQILLDDRLPVEFQAAQVVYTAGFGSAPADLASLVAGIVVRSIALAYGVTSEAAGSVSITYGVESGGAPVATLTDIERAALAPYKAVRAHAS